MSTPQFIFTMHRVDKFHGPEKHVLKDVTLSFLAGAKIGGPFHLVDSAGKPVSDSDFRGRFMLLYFGYTFCPDVCPTELQAMGRAVDLLGPAGDKVVPVFISVDPDRDSGTALG